MNTAEVADKLGTTPRVLRVFLRSSYSTFAAVGSNSRYDFNESELATLHKRFKEWDAKGGKAKTTTAKKKRPKATTPARKTSPEVEQRRRDEAVWAEEEDIVLPDIRDPRVRADVRRRAAAQEAQLELLLLKAGLHITQMGDRR